VNLACIAKLFGSSSRRWLNEFSETSAGIGESPRWQLNAESLKGGKNLVTGGRIHANLAYRKITIDLLARHGFSWQC
jgi:hypothetical protein